VQLDPDMPPGKQTKAIEHQLNPKQKKEEQNLKDDIPPATDKRQRVFKKNKIDRDDIADPPDVVQQSRGQIVRGAGHVDQKPQQ
jgi:hypothetical protein